MLRRSSASVLLLLALGATVTAIAAPKRTSFDPARHGFAFVNSFKNDIILDITTGGLCGGMVYTALDHFEAKKPMPRHVDYRPATGSPLERYIFGRQVDSIKGNLDKWAELGVNPFGARNSEFFRWGLQGFGGGRLQELRAKIDAGKPVPLGLWHADGHPDRPGDHQVLAIGYELGRYKGDLKSHQGDLKIFVYDPNYPDHTMTLVPDTRSQTYYYSNVARADREKTRWLTYFVDRKYRRKNPPTIPRHTTGAGDGRARELLLEISTGGDDLRGGRDNADATIHFVGKKPQVVRNINKSHRWIGGYTQRVPVKLREPVRPEDIAKVVISTRFGGGVGGDNWNMDRLVVLARGGGVNQKLHDAAGRPLRRFTGKVHSYTAGTRWLLADLGAGRRPLSGSLDAIVVYRGRRPQTEKNLSRGVNWAAGSRNRTAILLNQTVPVTSVTLMNKGGWDLNSLKLRLRKDGVDKVWYRRAGNPLHAFSRAKPAFQALPGTAAKALYTSPAIRRKLLSRPIRIRR